MINPLDLTGKHILVTGASSGIGKATAIHVSKLGARVALVARDAEKLKDTLYKLEGEGHSLHPFDLKQIENIEGLIKSIVSQEGALNGLVHCSGVATMRPLSMTRSDFLHDMMLLNFYAYVELIRCAAKKNYFVKGASFIGISSVESKTGDKGKTAYCSSKAAMDAATKCMAKELAPKKIRVNTIVPGFIKTAMYDSYIEKAGEDAFNSYVLGKQYLGLGETADIANAIAYLLSDAAKFITGTGLIADGGFLS